ncbi:PREDICTED: NEDD4-binding protein 2-like 2 [Gekko japonicus]|uniref:NEDD4-binding protein 2-like 2 n=1 Tax=Gekko japonicus TaxID=146911 RepID=A0ABM1L148_GEKJA|nr:PREDICTED: NEDD4-binding protein 2-like 2 [Gekko japonicus]
MLHAESKSRCLESQDGSAVEPCSKKMKSTEEPYGKSYDGLQSLYEEVHVKKTHSGFIPLSLFDDEDGVDETTRGLVPSKEVFLGIKPVTCKPSNAVNNTEITGYKYAFSGKNTAVVNNRENNESLEKYKNEGNTELYSTSKAFIGPIYKIEVVQQTKEKKNYKYRNHQKVPKAMRGGSSKKEMAPKRSLPSDIPKIEDELSQFYSEIHQLESDENILDKAGKDFHKQPVEYNKWNQIECISSQDLSYSKTTSSCDGGQCFYGEPSDRRICSEQNPYNGQMGHRTGNGQSFGSERNAWEAEKPCNKQAGSRFWNDSVPPFNPGWQQTPPFIIPYGPPPPQFIRNFNFQEPVPSSHHSNNFSSSNVGPFENTHINMSCSPSDKNSDRTSHSGTPSIQTIQNGYSVQERYIGNGFYETATCWKDAQQTEGSSSVSEQFLEGSLCESQKQLLILRGLPGSGKTTLSRILLGHSHDGIVFSTDDYFCQQDGWSYDVGQLGAAHDWNQKRAKQAMDQGRSPIIIDNTNTQAWEMKPYVEAALEKCYRVEFHEPDTWWKFNPEELEKKNKHGVSREKIIQMLERYEYQISIPVVMNSVLPFHKTSQRPPPQRRQRETVVKKKHKLHKMKQRRKRKRNRKMKGAAVKIVEKKPDPQTPSDKDWSQSGEEDSEDNRKSASIDESLKELIADGEVDSANESSLKCSELQKGSFCVSDTLLPDDYVVPLDWTISKEIYLRWKASVEKNQKKNRSKGYDALPAGGAALEDSKEVDGQEKQESSDANPQMHLFQ